MSRARKPYAAARRTMHSHAPAGMDYWLARKIIAAYVRCAFHGGPHVSVSVMPLPKGRVLFALRVGKIKHYAIFMGEHGEPIDKEYSATITQRMAISLLALWLKSLVAIFMLKQAAGMPLDPVESESVRVALALRARARQIADSRNGQEQPRMGADDLEKIQGDFERVVVRLCGLAD